MPDFSLGELLVVVIAALIFIGPKEMPLVIRTLAKALRAVRTLGHEATKMFEELARETGVNDIKETLKQEMTLIQGDDGKMYESYDASRVMLPAEKAPEEPKKPDPA